VKEIKLIADNRNNRIKIC